MQYGPKIATNGLVLALDAADMNSYSPNVIPNPTDVFANIGSEIQSCTLSRDTTIIRQYRSTPMKMVITGNDAFAGKYGSSAANLASALSGQTWTISVWAKASVATDGQLFIFGADTNGAVFTINDYSSGNMSITTSWQRFSFSYTFTNANTRYIQFRLDGTNTGGSGITIWWDGLQIERASSATQFNPYYYGNTIWKDLSGNNKNGTLTNGPTFNGSNCGSIFFDATDDFVSVGNIGAITSFTVLVWCYPTNVISYRNILDCNFNYNATTGNIGPRLEMTTSGNLSWLYSNTTNSNDSYYIQAAMNSGFVANSWYYVGITYNSSGNTSTTYLNGYDTTNGRISVGSPTGFVGTMNNVILGKGFFLDPARLYAGRIANTFIYNRALTAEEVLQNYNATKSRFGL